jgi:hypothetical protein
LFFSLIHFYPRADHSATKRAAPVARLDHHLAQKHSFFREDELMQFGQGEIRGAVGVGA